jgi:nitrous oxide reductase accessory protein NosL
MKKVLVVLAVLGLCFSAMAMMPVQDDIKMHPSCKYCGMDRAKFAHSRVLLTYDDGTAVGTCSIHCAAVDLAIHIDKTPKAVQVGDYSTKSLIDAEKASWVIGGSKMGVMTKKAKWAFATNDAAANFAKENGGEIAGYEQAIKASYEDMYADTKMIREKRKMAKGMMHKH